jgi:tetratricopeptide (TPR) repeat protein
MAQLRTALAEAVSGQGRVLAFVGAAGVGKTRLVTELAAEVPADSTRVLIGRCHESEQILPFGPWVDALGAGHVQEDRQWFQTLPLPIRRELGRLLPQLGPGESESATPRDYLQLFEGVGLLLRYVADEQPTVLILEDLHWADEMSIRLLAFIGHRLPAWRLLLVTTAREEDLVEAPMLQRTLAELEREPHVATVALGPLSRDDTVGLVQALARPGSEEAAVVRLGEHVWRTSAGNPLVVVEVMRAGTHNVLLPGLERLSVPERVRDIIGRQLERLDRQSRELVALASVIGRDFEFGLLQHASGLGDEEAAREVEELTRRRVLHSVDERLDFTHDRVREVAYGQILAPRRKLLHRRVAEALSILHAASLESHHLALGLHYAEGELWDKAVVHLCRAGARALGRSANREAVACFERALDALGQLPETQATLEHGFEIRGELHNAFVQLGEVDHLLERLREREALAERLNNDRQRAYVCTSTANIYMHLGRLDEGHAYLTSALEIARARGDLKLRILATTLLAQSHYRRGEYARVVQRAGDNLAALPAERVHEYFGNIALPSVADRGWLAMSLAELGRFAEAAEYEAEAIRLAESTRHPYTLSVALRAAGWLHHLRGNWVNARALIEREMRVLRTENIVLLLPHAVARSAWVLAQLGEASQALSQLREGEQHLERQLVAGIVGYRGWVQHALGRACLLLGRLDEARDLGDRVVETSQRHPGFAAHALHLLGDVATHHDRFDAEGGEAHYRQALALAAPRGMRPLIAHCHLGLGKLYCRTGKRQEAHQHLSIASTAYREMDMAFWLKQAEAELSFAPFTREAPADRPA